MTTDEKVLLQILIMASCVKLLQTGHKLAIFQAWQNSSPETKYVIKQRNKCLDVRSNPVFFGQPFVKLDNSLR